MGTAAVASSRNRRADEAVDEACDALLSELGQAPKAVLAFWTPGVDVSNLWRALRARLGDAALCGCSSEGVIAGESSLEVPAALVLVGMAFPGVETVSRRFDGFSSDGQRTGAEIAEWAAGFENPRVLMLFPDGVAGHIPDLFGALDAALPKSVVVVGGASGDDMQFERTFQAAAGEVGSEGVSALLLCGEIEALTTFSHGCVPVGLPQQVTRAEGGWVERVGEESAWHVLRQYLANPSDMLTPDAITHLAVIESVDDSTSPEAYQVHVPMGMNPDTGALFFPSGGPQQGDSFQLARRDPLKVRDRAKQCATELVERISGPVDLVLQFDCAGRGALLFGPRASGSIVAPLRDAFPTAPPWAGFHTFGEISRWDGASRSQNYTVVLCALRSTVHG